MKNITNSKGQSLVELALSFTLLLLLLGGAVDLGRAFFGFVAIRDAAQEGAVYASLNPNFVYKESDHTKDPDPGKIVLDYDGLTAMDLDEKLDTRIRSSSQQPLNLNNKQDILIDASKDCTPLKGSPSVTVSVTYRFRTIMPLMSEFMGSKGYIAIPAVVVQTILANECS